MYNSVWICRKDSVSSSYYKVGNWKYPKQHTTHNKETDFSVVGMADNLDSYVGT